MEATEVLRVERAYEGKGVRLRWIAGNEIVHDEHFDLDAWGNVDNNEVLRGAWTFVLDKMQRAHWPTKLPKPAEDGDEGG